MEHVQDDNARAEQRENEKSSYSHTETRMGGGANDGDNVGGRRRRNLDGRSGKLNRHNPLQTLCHPTKRKGTK